MQKPFNNVLEFSRRESCGEGFLCQRSVCIEITIFTESEKVVDEDIENAVAGAEDANGEVDEAAEEAAAEQAAEEEEEKIEQQAPEPTRKEKRQERRQNIKERIQNRFQSAGKKIGGAFRRRR